MKKILNILITSTSIFVFVGCGVSEKPRNRIMEKGESYSVSSGDKIIKSSENTLIRVTHKDGKSSSKVELLDGNATITHPEKK